MRRVDAYRHVDGLIAAPRYCQCEERAAKAARSGHAKFVASQSIKSAPIAVAIMPIVRMAVVARACGVDDTARQQSGER